MALLLNRNFHSDFQIYRICAADPEKAPRKGTFIYLESINVHISNARVDWMAGWMAKHPW